MSFELRHLRDGMARIGKLNLAHGIVETPLLMPVINPKRNIVTMDEIKRTGAEMIITNAYLTWKEKDLHEKAIKNGIHGLIGFNGPIMTDSGAFQLMLYGEVDVSNSEITQFQEAIKSDIGVFLDIPLAKGNYDQYQAALTQTIQRADEHIALRQKETIQWAGPIQGGRFLDLIGTSAKEMGQRSFDIHAIGSVVPLMERYDYKTVVQMILRAKKHLPPNRPVHLFGAGHPMMLALAVYLGIDLFDSAAYVLMAKEGRYLTVDGTTHLAEMEFLPCSCPVCASLSITEFKKLPANQKAHDLAMHNLYVSFQELKIIKHAITEGRLLNHVYSRCVRHPALYEAFKCLITPESQQLIELYEPRSQDRALFISHPDLMNHSSIIRHREKILQRFYQYQKNIYCFERTSGIIPGVTDGQIIILDELLGPIPGELQSVYPLMQNLSVSLESAPAKDTIETFLTHLSPDTTIFCHKSLKAKYSGLANATVFDAVQREKIDEQHRIRAIIDYQFGKNASKNVAEMQFEYSKRTGILRQVSSTTGELLAMVRPDDFFLIPQIALCKLVIEAIPPPTNCVVAHNDAIPFLQDGKSLFSKHVLSHDPNIRAGDEVFIISENSQLIATGQAILGARELGLFQRGIGIKTRRSTADNPKD